MQMVTFDDANKANQRAVLYWFRVQMALKLGKVDAESLDVLTGLVPRGLYEHFKSKEDDPKFYLVYGVVPDVNGKFDPVVYYTSLYGPLAGKSAGRALYDSADDAFWGPIVRPDDPEHPWVGLRFTLVKELTIRQFATLEERISIISTYKTRASLLAEIERELDFLTYGSLPR